MSGQVPGRGSARGFTLLEVLVTLAIFALAAVVLGAAYVNVLGSYAAVARNSGHGQDLRLVRAAVLAEPDRAKVEPGGSFPLPDGRTATWTAVVEGTEVADLFRVTFRCAVPGGAAADEAWTREEVFFLLRPTWSDPTERERLRLAAQQRRREAGRP